MVRRLLLVLLVLVLLLVAGGGLLVWRLQRGPVSLAAFTPVIDRVVAASSPYAISFSNPELTWLRSEGNLGVQVDNIEVRTHAGDFVASAPRASATLALRPLLFDRDVQLVTVELQLPEIELNLHKDAPPTLSFAGQAATLPATQAAGPGGLAAFLGDQAAAQDPRLASLQLVRVNAPLLQVYNEESGELADADDPVFELRREGEAWSVGLAAAIDKGRVAVRLVPSRGAGSAPQHLSVDLFRAPLEVVHAVVPTVPFEGLQLPVSGGLSVDVAADASLGPGTFDFDVDPTTLDLPNVLEKPIALKSATFEGSISAGMQTVKLDKVEAVTDRFSIAAQGTATMTSTSVSGDLTVTPKGLSATDIPSLWPVTAGGDGRKWVKENVLAGTATGGTVKFTVPVDAPQVKPAISGTFVFNGVSVRYLDTFPPAQGLSGNATFDLDTMRFTVGPAKTGDVEVLNGEVTLSAMSKPTPTILDAKADLRSAVGPALKLVNLPPLELLKGTDLPWDKASGTQTTKLTLKLPLKDKVLDSEIVYKAEVALKGAGVPDVRPGYSMADGDFTLTAKPNLVDAKGKASVNKVPVTVTYDEQLIPKKGLSRKANVKADLDARGAKALQIPWPGQATGTAAVNLDVTLPKGKGSPRYDLNLDLKRMGIQAPELVFEKMTGTAGKLSVTATQPDPKTVSLDAIWLQVPGLNGKGSARVGLDPTSLDKLKVDRLEMPLGALAVDLERRQGSLRGNVAIDRLDLRPVVGKLTAGGAGGGSDPLPNMDIRLTAKELRVGEAPFKAVDARVVRDPGGWGPVNITAKMEANNDLSVDLVRGKATGTLNAKASDAGWLARSLTSGQAQYQGGRVRATATIRQTPSFRADGELKVRDFTITAAPLLARVLTLASFSGLTNALSGQGIPIEKLTVPFAYENSVLRLEELRFVGSQIGARAEGTVNLAQNSLKIDGTVAPAYTINRILGRIPIVGNILRGDKADAALAATFSITGSLDSPQVFVNPLAALVPGMVRDLFNALSDSGTPKTGPIDER
ncbi:MAG: AsmA-like C-terminal domain-containing protein [Geminicoccaceae bacterium]